MTGVSVGVPRWQHWADATVHSRVFETAIVAVIFLNALTIGLTTYPLDPGLQAVLSTLDNVFLAIFVAELLLRFAAVRFNILGFARNPWNLFDFFVVTVCFLPGVSNDATALRMLRLARVSRLIRLMPDVRVLASGLRRAAGPAFSLLSLTVLLCYLYAVVGWVMFHDRITPDKRQYFDNLGEAMLTLFELLTLEGWNSTLHDLRSAHPLALPYVISFLLIGTYIIINLVVGVVITSLDEAYKQSERANGRVRALAGDTNPDLLVMEIRELLEQLEGHLHTDERPKTHP